MTQFELHLTASEARMVSSFVTYFYYGDMFNDNDREKIKKIISPLINTNDDVTLSEDIARELNFFFNEDGASSLIIDYIGEEMFKSIEKKIRFCLLWKKQ